MPPNALKRIKTLAVISMVAALPCKVFASESAPDLNDDLKAAIERYQLASTQQNPDAIVSATSEIVALAGQFYELDPGQLIGLARAHLLHGNALVEIRNKEAALKNLQQAVKLFENVHEHGHEEMITPLMALGHAHTRFQTKKSGRTFYDRAIAIAKDVHGKKSGMVGLLMFEASERQLLHWARDRELAEKQMHRANEILLEALGPKHRVTALSEYWRGIIYARDLRMKRAAEHFEAALSTFQVTEPDGPYVIATHKYLLETYGRSRKDDLAAKHAQALGLIREKQGLPPETGAEIKPVYHVQPIYPKEALERKIEGHVILTFDVDTNGRAVNIKTADRKGHTDFTVAARHALKKSRFVVQFEKGKPVQVTGGTYKYTFDLGL